MVEPQIKQEPVGEAQVPIKMVEVREVVGEVTQVIRVMGARGVIRAMLVRQVIRAMLVIRVPQQMRLQ